MRTDSTVPACWNSSRRSSSVAWKERLPTNSFAGIASLLPRSGPKVLLSPGSPAAHGGTPRKSASARRVHRRRPVLRARTILMRQSSVKGQVRIVEQAAFFISRGAKGSPGSGGAGLPLGGSEIDPPADSSIERDRDPCQEGRSLRGQETDEVRHLLGQGDPTQGEAPVLLLYIGLEVLARGFRLLTLQVVPALR